MIISKILDIGARYGIHPSWKNFTGDSYYDLIEADLEEVIRLKKKYKNYKNIKIKNLAFGKQGDFLELKILNNPAMSGFVDRIDVTPRYTGKIKFQKKVAKIKKIQIVSLNNYLIKSRNSYDFLKLDVEGFEVTILKNGLNIFKSLLGARSEVCFTKAYKSIHVKNEGTFNALHEIFRKQGFILLNLDYDGRGDFYSNLISENSKYGQLESTDAVWVKDPKYAIKNFTIEEIIKYSCFLILNNGIDVALYVLKNTYKKFNHFQKYKNNKSLKFIKQKICKNFYSLKFLPNQDINKHKIFFETLFNCPYPEMNKFNEMSEFNPY